MNPSQRLFSYLNSTATYFVPLVLWSLLWLAVPSGGVHLSEFIHPGFTWPFARVLLMTAALGSAGVSTIIILRNAANGVPREFKLISPLGFAFVYGLVGIVSVSLAPDRSVALFWVGIYLTVPLALWAVAWNGDGGERLSYIVRANWLFLAIAVGALFATALLYLDLAEIILTPTLWNECRHNAFFNGNSWHHLTSFALRPTGVGRYAALAGLAALPGLWQKNWNLLWAVVFAASMILLLASGARSSLIGFAAAVPLIIVFQANRKQAAGIFIGMVVALSLLWTVGGLPEFVDTCIWRKSSTAAAPGNPTPSEAASLTAETDRSAVSAPLDPVNSSAESPDASASATADSQTSASGSGDQPASNEAKRPAQEGPKPSPSTTADGAQLDQSQSGEDAPQTGNGSPTTVESAVSTPESGSAVRADADGNSAPADNPSDPDADPEPPVKPKRTSFGPIPVSFFNFSGRSDVWIEALETFQSSPLLGFGFQADREILGTHAHNAGIQALLQTGLIGSAALVIAFLYSLYLAQRALRRLKSLNRGERTLVIQCVGILAFLVIRAVFESTGAIFGVDWLIVGPCVLYLQMISDRHRREQPIS